MLGVVASVGEGVEESLVGKHAALIPLIPASTASSASSVTTRPAIAIHSWGPGRRAGLLITWKCLRPTSSSYPMTSVSRLRP